jgi:hypothetical protein
MLYSGENVFFIVRVKGYESDGGESDSSVKTVKSNKSIRSNKSGKMGSVTNLPLADSIVLDSPLLTTSPQVKSFFKLYNIPIFKGYKVVLLLWGTT